MLKCLALKGFFEVNCYVYIDDATNRALLIDPGAQPEVVLSFLQEHNLILERILVTHGHFDHLGGVLEIQKALGVTVSMIAQGKAYAEDPSLNLSRYCGAPLILKEVAYFNYEPGMSFKVGHKSLSVAYVPGHTQDSVMYISCEGWAIVGDAVSMGKPGLTNFPGGDAKLLKESLRKEVLTLPKDTILYQGHGDPIKVLDLHLD
ncbi:MAG: MBL fold metallo-hydrolase [Desulfovibrionaceae bacterium]|nr:MBL fold metallo-hydrolase [Desulfovibrionaceae bacterium]